MKLKVGRDRIELNGKMRKFTYRDVQYDQDGWADAKLFIPADFDLMDLKVDERLTTGWSMGKTWDGLGLKKNDQISFWKKKEEKY